MRDLPFPELMSQETAKKVIDFLSEQETETSTLVLFGGEPLLNKPAIEFIMSYTQELKKLYERKFDYVITTNATLLDDNMIHYIVKQNFGLMVSLDGPKEIHDSQCPMRTGAGSFDMATANIKELMKYRPVGVRATVTHPMQNLKSLVNFFNDFGFSIMTIGAAENRVESSSTMDFTPEDYQSIVAQQDEMVSWFLEYLKNKKEPPYFPDRKWINILKEGKISSSTKVVNCGAGHNKVAVSPDGTLYPCAKYCGMKNWQIGTLATGVDDDKVQSLWIGFLKCIHPTCGKCWAYPICEGPCIWDCSMDNGTFSFNDRSCFFRRKGIERSIYMYSKLQKYWEEHDFSIFQKSCMS